MITKKVEPTGDVCIKFTEEELTELGLKPGDKLSFKDTQDGGIALSKYESIEIDMSDWSREVFEAIIFESCRRDVSVNDVISDILESYIEKEELT
jgi:bifunctional DNA-binding transcriptional regulator/antitoxin component of YhaV-PrlF toxin-antitoxin module